MNDCLVGYNERDVARRVDNENIIQGVQNMKPCRRQL